MDLFKFQLYVIKIFNMHHLGTTLSHFHVAKSYAYYVNACNNYVLSRYLIFSWFWYGKVLTYGSVVLVGDWLGFDVVRNPRSFSCRLWLLLFVVAYNFGSFFFFVSSWWYLIYLQLGSLLFFGMSTLMCSRRFWPVVKI